MPLSEEEKKVEKICRKNKVKYCQLLLAEIIDIQIQYAINGPKMELLKLLSILIYNGDRINGTTIGNKIDYGCNYKYLEISFTQFVTEVSEDCLPSGTSLKIDICHPFGCLVSMETAGNNYQEIGEADADLVDVAL